MDQKQDTDFKNTIITTIIQPNYINEIKEFIASRTAWRNRGVFYETISKILLGSGSVLSFAAGVYSNQTLSFLAGSISTISLLSFQFSSFSFLESKKSTKELNVLLEKIKVDTIPDLSIIEIQEKVQDAPK